MSVHVSVDHRSPDSTRVLVSIIDRDSLVERELWTQSPVSAEPPECQGDKREKGPAARTCSWQRFILSFEITAEARAACSCRVAWRTSARTSTVVRQSQENIARNSAYTSTGGVGTQAGHYALAYSISFYCRWPTVTRLNFA